MNNQAAQTMPELPDPAFVTPDDNLYTVHQMRAMYQQGYAAALSQTAGVAEGYAVVPIEPTGDMLDAILAPWLIGTKTQRECLTEGYRAMIVAAQSNDYASRCDTRDTYGAQPGSPEFDGADAFERYLRQTTQAAPAASGVHPDALPDGTLSKSTAKRVTALAAASVSERALEYRHSTHHVNRGPESLPCYCEATSDHLVGEEASNGEALARRFHEAYERLAPSFGYETRTETRQFDPTTPNGRLMIAVCSEIALEQALTQQRGAVAWTHDAESWGNALNEAAWVFVEQCPEKSALLFNNTKAPLRAAILKYAELVGAATTPQPSASVGGRESFNAGWMEGHDKGWTSGYQRALFDSAGMPRNFDWKDAKAKALAAYGESALTTAAGVGHD